VTAIEPTVAEPWERREEETTVAFEAFATYRDMGLKRSCDRVAKQLGKSNTLIERWCTRHEWVDRSAAWDARLDEQARESVVDQVREMAERHIKLARGFLSKVAERLLQLRPEELTPTEVIRWGEVAVRLERMSMGEVADGVKKVEVTGADGGPIQVTDPDDLTDEQLAVIAAPAIVSKKSKKGD